VQTVGGNVNVGNLPAVQAVSGSFAVSNLPVDTNGNLRVILSPVAPHFVGYTIARFKIFSSVTALNQACGAQYPASRTCTQEEFVFSLPTGTYQDGDCALFAMIQSGTSFYVGLELDLKFGHLNQCEEPDDPLNPTYRAACCGF